MHIIINEKKREEKKNPRTCFLFLGNKYTAAGVTFTYKQKY